MTTYTNTTAGGLLGSHPRAVYRITLERSAAATLAYAVGALKWTDVVREVINAIAASPYGIPLGVPMPSDNERVAVIEVRAPTAPATADSVGDLVRAAESGSMSANVVRVERLAPVPATGSDAARERDESREAELTRAQADSGAYGLLGSVRRAVSRAGMVGAVGLAAGVVIVAAFVIGPKAERIGKSSLWE